MPANDVEQGVWNHHVSWSALANKLKKDRTTARKTVLVLTIIGGTLQTWAGMTKSDFVRMNAGIVGAVALVLVPFIAKWALNPENTRRWLRARSISEGIKSEFYTYRASAAPYDTGTPLNLLVEKARAIREWGKDFANLLAGIQPESEPAPDVLGPEKYIADRVKEQIDRFYMPKAALNFKYAQRFRVLEVVLSAAAAVLGTLATSVSLYPKGVAAIVTSPLGPWVAVLTTVAGTIAAFAAEGRYDFQATTYYATAANLKDLVDEWILKGKPQPPSAEWSAFVKSCEETISAENRGWMAKLDDSQKQGAQPAVAPVAPPAVPGK